MRFSMFSVPKPYNLTIIKGLIPTNVDLCIRNHPNKHRIVKWQALRKITIYIYTCRYIYKCVKKDNAFLLLI